ncbi:MAG: response regulator [Candidatus Caldarchaeum sp.]
MSKVLLIDDDVNILRLYSKVLGSHGHVVEVAVDGEEGIRKLENFTPDIIFLDYILPTINGAEVLKKIKELPGYRYIPVVMLTATADKLEETFAYGATGYLHKGPNTVKKLLDCINLYLK